MAKNVAIAAAAENVIYRNWRRKTKHVAVSSACGLTLYYVIVIRTLLLSSEEDFSGLSKVSRLV